MKSFVAFFLVLIIFTSGSIQGQTPSRRGNQNPAGKPRTETLRICQGVPVPEGYVIVAYMTSSACPHGAYLLKKQDDYESSLAINGGPRQTNESASGSSTQSGSIARPERSTQTARTSGSGVRVTPSSTPATRNSASSSGASASITRPRRVGSQASDPIQSSDTNQSQNTTQSTNLTQPQDTGAQDAGEAPKAPPVLIGSQPAAARRPPTLVNAGTQSNVATPAVTDETAAAAGPEEVSEGDVVRVNTALVSVPVSVLDRQGRFVPDLKREDFHVFENGVEQSIAYFEPAEKPFTVALLLDTSPSTHFHLSEIREAAIEFAKQLRPQDRVLVVSFNDEVLLLTEATNDGNLIETVIEENANTGNSTRLYDAVDLTIKERLNKIKGRKAIVLFTDGVDTSSQQATYQTTLREVEELDALIYPIQYDTSDYLRAMQNAGSVPITITTTQGGLFGTRTTTQTYNVPVNGGAPPAGVGATKADYDRADHYLHALADKTGGRLYQANDTTQLAQAFTRIAEELRRQYSLGYYPKTEGDQSNERRLIKVKVGKPNLAVKARDSYVKSSTASPNK